MTRLFEKMKSAFRKPNPAPRAENSVQPVQAAPAAEETMEEAPAKLLVVGRESAFSEEVMAYALDMAERLSYEIVALNTAPLSCDTFQLFSSSRKKICEDFQRLSEESAGKFSERAARRNIAFEHAVKFSETDRAIDEIRRDTGHIEFVIAEPEEQRSEARPERGARVRRDIHVYSMV